MKTFQIQYALELLMNKIKVSRLKWEEKGVKNHLGEALPLRYLRIDNNGIGFSIVVDNTLTLPYTLTFEDLYSSDWYEL